MLTYYKVLKFNPYHDEKGRFTSKEGAVITGDGSVGEKGTDFLKEAAAKGVDVTFINSASSDWSEFISFHGLPPETTPLKIAEAYLGKDFTPAKYVDVSGTEVPFGYVQIKVVDDSILEFIGQNVIDSKGREIKEITRTIDFSSGQAEHKYLRLSDESQGSGLGKESLLGALNLYSELGLSRLELQANLDAGGYAWAKLGITQAEGEFGALLYDVFDMEIGSLEGQLPDGTNIHSDEVKAEYDFMLEFMNANIDEPNLPFLMANMKTPNLDKELAPYIRSKMIYAPSQVPRTLVRAMLQRRSWFGDVDLTDTETLDNIKRRLGAK